MKRLIRAALTKLGIRAPRCDKARISQPRFLDQDTYIEQCALEAHHRGDHEPGPRVPSGAATELTRHDQDHGHYQEDQ